MYGSKGPKGASARRKAQGGRISYRKTAGAYVGKKKSFGGDMRITPRGQCKKKGERGKKRESGGEESPLGPGSLDNRKWDPPWGRRKREKANHCPLMEKGTMKAPRTRGDR